MCASTILRDFYFLASCCFSSFLFENTSALTSCWVSKNIPLLSHMLLVFKNFFFCLFVFRQGNQLEFYRSSVCDKWNIYFTLWLKISGLCCTEKIVNILMFLRGESLSYFLTDRYCNALISAYEAHQFIFSGVSGRTLCIEFSQ